MYVCMMTQIKLQVAKNPSKAWSVLEITLKYLIVGLLGALENIEYPFIATTIKSTPIWNGSST